MGLPRFRQRTKLMTWQFWKATHTVDSVARRLATGLRDGSMVLDEPLADEPFDASLDSDTIVLQFEVADETSDAAILDMVKARVGAADRESRSHGGPGLRLGKMIVAY